MANYKKRRPTDSMGSKKRDSLGAIQYSNDISNGAKVFNKMVYEYRKSAGLPVKED